METIVTIIYIILCVLLFENMQDDANKESQYRYYYNSGYDNQRWNLQYVTC